MNKYELVYVLSTTQGDEAVAAASEKVQALVASKGTVTNVEEWGRRKLAYEIRDEKEGFYVVVNFEAAAMQMHKLVLALPEQSRESKGR